MSIKSGLWGMQRVGSRGRTGAGAVGGEGEGRHVNRWWGSAAGGGGYAAGSRMCRRREVTGGGGSRKGEPKTH